MKKRRRIVLYCSIAAELHSLSGIDILVIAGNALILGSIPFFFFLFFLLFPPKTRTSLTIPLGVIFGFFIIAGLCILRYTIAKHSLLV